MTPGSANNAIPDETASQGGMPPALKPPLRDVLPVLQRSHANREAIEIDIVDAHIHTQRVAADVDALADRLLRRRDLMRELDEEFEAVRAHHVAVMARLIARNVTLLDELRTLHHVKKQHVRRVEDLLETYGRLREGA